MACERVECAPTGGGQLSGGCEERVEQLERGEAEREQRRPEREEQRRGGGRGDAEPRCDAAEFAGGRDCCGGVADASYLRSPELKQMKSECLFWIVKAMSCCRKALCCRLAQTGDEIYSGGHDINVTCQSLGG